MLWANEKRLTLLENRVMQHMEREEQVMAKQFEKIDDICSELHKLSEKFEVDILQTDIKITRATDELRTQVQQTYATKKELADGLSAIRDTARFIWLTLTACVVVVAWFIDRVMP